MLSDLAYLWAHRERPRRVKRWVVVWGKRVLQAIPLARLTLGAVRLRAQGASVGRLVVVGKARIEGSRRNLTLGNEVSLGRCHIALHDRVSIGNRVVINDGAILLTATHALGDPRWRHKRRSIEVGDYAWIATGAIVLPGVRIGRGAVVGAGAVVRVDVPDYALAVGNPATITGAVRTQVLQYSPVMFNAPFEAWVGSDFLAGDGVGQQKA